MGNGLVEAKNSIFRDIRRYYCEYCGICRSKKALITTHILSEHQHEVKEKENSDGKKLNTCKECGASFKKPAHLKQHMQSHSSERPFTCPVDDCDSSYGRKDHLNRHMLLHKGKLFDCPVENCNSKFAYEDNLKSHMIESHSEASSHDEASSSCIEDPKEYVDECESSYGSKDHLNRHMLLHNGKLFDSAVENCNSKSVYEDQIESHSEAFSCMEDPKEYTCQCPVPGCSMAFKYPSKLQKHANAHVKLDTVEALCIEPGCMKYFSDEQCLREHTRSCHQYVECEQCGARQLKKNMKRHLRMHGKLPSEKLDCSFEGCLSTFSTRWNLNQHVKAVHLDLKPFACSIVGCNKKFAFKHVKDRHEKTGFHIYTLGDFEESDEQFHSRPRGGVKRKYPVIETLLRKRVELPSESDQLEFCNTFLDQVQ